MNVPRWPAVFLLLAVVVGVAVADRTDRTDAGADEAAVDVVATMPVASGDTALESTWYCAGGTAIPGGSADHVVIVTNAGNAAAEGVLTAYPVSVDGTGAVTRFQPVAEPLSVAPQTSLAVRLADLAEAEFVGALVELGAGTVVVEHQVQGPTGSDVVPCSATASSTWHFAAGSTTRDGGEILALFNPFPDEAVVDITFATDEGSRAPQAYDGLIVPANSLLPVDITDVVPRFGAVSATIEARSGRLAVDRIQVFDGSEGRIGLALSAGAPRPAAQWVFPMGRAGDGVGDQYVVYNPTDRTAEVEFDVQLDDPAANGTVELFELTIPPGDRIVIDVGDVGNSGVPANQVVDTSGRIPEGITYWSAVRSFNGVPVVAERVTTRTAPADPTGVASTLGSSLMATRHVTIGARSDQTGQLDLAVVNPSPETITVVSVSALVDGEVIPIPELTEIEVAPRRRFLFQVADRFDAERHSLLVEASQPVTVERGGGVVEGTGISSSQSIPLDGIEDLPLPFVP